MGLGLAHGHGQWPLGLAPGRPQQGDLLNCGMKEFALLAEAGQIAPRRSGRQVSQGVHRLVVVTLAFGVGADAARRAAAQGTSGTSDPGIHAAPVAAHSTSQAAQTRARESSEQRALAR